MPFDFAHKLLLRLLALSAALMLIPSVFSPTPACAAADASRITVNVEGRGPDVVFISGLASSAHVWDAEAARLKDRYRVHLIQVQGFAGTPAGANATGPIVAPTVEAIDGYIRSSGLKRPAVIGHSLGGLMGMMLARRHPGDVGRLMIVDSLPWFGMVMGPTASLETITPMAVGMRDRTLHGSQADYAAAEPAVMARLLKSKDAAARAAVAAASASDHAVVARAMYEDLTTDLRPDLASIIAPVVVLYPWDASTGDPRAAFDSLYQGAFAPLPNKRVVRIDGSYHFIQVDQPEAFDREVKAFLSR